MEIKIPIDIEANRRIVYKGSRGYAAWIVCLDGLVTAQKFVANFNVAVRDMEPGPPQVQLTAAIACFIDRFQSNS